MTIRVEVRSPANTTEQGIVQNARALGIRGLHGCQRVRLYFLAQHPGADAVDRLCALLLADPVTEQATWRELAGEALVCGELSPSAGHWVIEVAPRLGVTDVEARELVRGMTEIGLPVCEVTTGL